MAALSPQLGQYVSGESYKPSATHLYWQLDRTRP
ncbi:hypothetical protein Pan181_39010 [Aeoliella mucimassa]|uniref:Uncharacterized protein n=1 Tax=Aeoliella mucimassa TaxID=2527972 RepID=A0A518ASH6_9BACT|nr:hypothetical protein Pan181_39010 [Aeoliella mucimassa]